MDFGGYFDIPTWILLLVLCATLLFVYGTSTYKVWRDLGVEGPAPTPFFGNINEMFDPRVGVREAIRNWQGRYGRIFGLYYFRKPVLVVTDPDALKQILVKDFNVFVDRYFVGDGKLQHRIIQMTIFFAQGQSWRRLRKIMTPTFSSGKLKLLTHYINKTAAQLSHNLTIHALQGKSVAAKVVFGAYALDVIAGTAFGLDLDSQGDLDAPFIQHAKSLMSVDKMVQLKLALAGIFPMCIPLLRMLKIGYFKYSDIKFFQTSLRALVAERMKVSKRHSDFLQLLLEAEFEAAEGSGVGDVKLSMDEIAAQGLFFMIAGYETTSSTLQYLFYELARRQEVQDKILAEIRDVVREDREPTYDDCQHLRYSEAVLEETLRMYPPVHILTRLAVRNTTVNGIPVPRGTGIIIPAYNIGRDPDLFPDPDTFNPERFLDSARHEVNPATFLPFGFGPRQCIGMRLAMMELKVALVHVLRKMKIASATPEMLEIDDYGGTLATKVPIQIKMEIRA